MDALKLPRPHRMDEAVPANLSSGMRHDADGVLLLQPRPSQGGYAGDLSPELAWQWVQSGEALVLDVRTDAEREWVGFVPAAVPAPWKQWPGMALNPQFDTAVQEAGATGKKLLMLCRSGVRSIAAAKRATELGFEAYNVLEGFEGEPDSRAQRGHKGGWRMRGLPWRQN
jgi:sulfur dioxygenase